MKYSEPQSPFSSPACQTNTSERLGLLGALGERLGDLEQRHRSGAVVVGAVVDRVQSRLVNLSQAVEDDANLRVLLGRRRAVLIVFAPADARPC